MLRSLVGSEMCIRDRNRQVVKNLYEQMPEPRVVVAVGICAASGGIFRECYNIVGGVDRVIPVDIYVPGCAARPEQIIDGVVRALSILEEKRAKMKETAQHSEEAGETA